MKIYLSYPEGAHPAHVYQAESINATIIPYTRFYSYIFKDINVLISEGFRPMLIGSALKRFGKVSMHVNILFGNFIVGIGKYHLFKNLLKESLDYVDIFVANSTLTSEIFLSNFGEKYKQKVEVCWPLPNIKLFSKVHSSLLKYENYEDCKHEVRICYLGHLSYYDGADLLPKIFINLRRDFRNILMYVIGTGPLQAELLSVAKSLSEFKVLGYQPINVILNLFSKCQFFIYPARFKAFGLPVVEAMATGLIPLVTVKTGARDFVQKVNPNLVTPLDLKVFINKISELITMNCTSLKEISIKAREVALSWNENMAKQYFLRIIKRRLR